jgi:hypothetical protein
VAANRFIDPNLQRGIGFEIRASSGTIAKGFKQNRSLSGHRAGGAAITQTQFRVTFNRQGLGFQFQA